MAISEKKKYRKFYLSGSILWVTLVITAYLGGLFQESVSLTASTQSLLRGTLGAITVFGIFGIPIIFLVSLFIHLVEYFLNKFPDKDQ